MDEIRVVVEQVTTYKATSRAKEKYKKDLKARLEDDDFEDGFTFKEWVEEVFTDWDGDHESLYNSGFIIEDDECDIRML